MLGRPLLPAAVQAVTDELARRGANVDRIRRLARRPVTALELDVSGVPDLADLRRDLTRAAVGHGADVAVSPAGIVRHGRRLVVMDVDSTLIRDEVIELLAAHAGRQEDVAEVTERAMRGELDFAASLHERVATLEGLPVGVFEQVRAELRLTPGARTLVQTLHELGFTVALVSGGLHGGRRPVGGLPRDPAGPGQPARGVRRPAHRPGARAASWTGPPRLRRCVTSPAPRACR